MKKWLLIAFAALAVLFVVLVVRTLLHRPPPHEAVAAVTVAVDAETVAQHVAQAIQFKTVSNEAPLPIDQTQFEGFIDWVKATYPDVVTRLGLMRIEVYGNVAVVPGLMIAASDTRHYGEIADNSYRFNPMVVSQADTAGFHGTNEKISVDNLTRATQTYVRIIELGTSSSSP